MKGTPLDVSTTSNVNGHVQKQLPSEPSSKRRRKAVDENEATAKEQAGDGVSDEDMNGKDQDEESKHEEGEDEGSIGDARGGGDRGRARQEDEQEQEVEEEQRFEEEHGTEEEKRFEEEQEAEEQRRFEEKEFEVEEEEEEEQGEHDEDGGENTEQADGVDSPVADMAERPGSNIVKAKSAWMLFLVDNRDQVRKDNPGLPIGPMQKILSEMWKGLDETETARYAKLAEEDKARMKREMEAAGLTRLPSKKSEQSSPVPGGPTSLVLPLARVRKTIRLDPAVGNISKEGLLVVAKATEVFMAMMADQSWKIGRQTGRKSVKPCDVADFVFAAPEMYWLKDEFREERSSVKRHNKPEATSKVGAAKGGIPVAKGAGAITSFFNKQAKT